MSTPIYVNNKVVGQVDGGVFIKRISASKHFLRQPPAIAFDVDSIEQAKQAGAEAIEIFDTDTGGTYYAPIALLDEKGFALNRGFGRQVALAMKWWNKQGAQAETVMQAKLF